MEQLYELYAKKLKTLSTEFVRYLYQQINWNSQLIVIMGARGVGKTTMLLQRIILSGEKDESLYISADNTFFAGNTLYDVATKFAQSGGRVLYIDEIHKYQGWSKEVKMMYDYLPEIKVVISGSSILELIKGTDADLSRRAIRYKLEGLSFREYLNFTLGLHIPAYSLEDILAGKVEIPAEVKYPLAHFKEYLTKGYFPFFKQDDYFQRLENVINQTMEVDIPVFAKMNISTARKLKQLLYIISRSVPFKPNYTEIGRALSSDRGTVADHLVYMEKSTLIRQLNFAPDGMELVQKTDKVYLGNTCFIYALADDKPDIGNIRETFFYCALCVNHKVTSSLAADFLVEGHTFEVGGKSKNQKQIKNVKDAFIVKDDIENAYMNIIPLWMLGFNY